MKEYKKVFKIFVAGQEEKECEWLSQMSKLGYHLETVSFACYYTFKKGEPKDYTYMIDMKEKDQVDEGEYVAIYEEYGIEYIDKSADFYYFKGNNNIETKYMMQNEQGRYLNRINSHKKVILLAGLLNVAIFIINNFQAYRMSSYAISYTSYINLAVGIFGIFVYRIMNKRVQKLKEEGVKSPYKTNMKDWPKLWTFLIIFIILIIIYGILVLFNL